MNPLNALSEKYFTEKELLKLSFEKNKGLNTLQGFQALLNHPETNHLWLVQTLSDILAMPWLELEDFKASQIPLHIISEPLLRQYPILPLWRRSSQIYVGVSDPFQPLLVEVLSFYTQLSIELVLVEKPKLESLRKTLFNNPALSLQALPHLKNTTSSSKAPSSPSKDNIEDPPLIRYVNQLLQSAAHKHASDIHFEPQDKNLHIRFRIDGVLYTQPSPPEILSNRILSRIKIMAHLDITERRLPQDGRFSFIASGFSKPIDCRISTCPTLQGEKISVRLLDSQYTTLDIEKLGLNTSQYALYLAALKKPQGMILVTGPTGSGKTLTLYSGLSYLNQAEVNIASVEDPIEVALPGINQVNIHPKIGLDFKEVLKVFLRQDPDIIMVGEMRDEKTAHIAIQAAQTGHLVLSTLHTNSATETLTRLINMGVASYNVASSVNLIIAQRLARLLCAHCKEPELLSPEILAQQGIVVQKPISAFKAKGCKKCTQGYRGRIGVFELLSMTATLSESILKGETTSELFKKAKEEGMLTLKEAAFEKVQNGLIDLAEMRRVS